MRPDAIVCHPGPINRGVELDSFMADHPERSVILDQVYAGILRAHGRPVPALGR